MAHPRASLPGMPKEIQLEILRNLLLTRRTARVGSHRIGPNEGLQPAILRTCSDLWTEATSILYRENIFLRVIINWRELRCALEDFGVYEVVSPANSLAFEHHSFDISINFNPRFATPTYHMIIASEGVRSLCNVLWILTSTTAVPVHSIHIQVLAPTLELAIPRKTQGAILAPFDTQWHVSNMSWTRGTHTEYVCGKRAAKPRKIDVLPPMGLLMAMRFFKEQVNHNLLKGEYMEAAVLGSKSLYVGHLLDCTPTLAIARNALFGPSTDPNSIWLKLAAAFFRTQIRHAFSFSKLKHYHMAHKHAFCAIATYRYKKWLPTLPVLQREAEVVRKIRVHSSADEASTCYSCREVGLKYYAG